MSSIQDLRQAIQEEVFDFRQLMQSLRKYAKPRDKISSLLSDGSIIRVKKGLYVFGERYRRRPWSREILANLIYGPSYVSLQYALGYYGLIPEQVQVVTSVTTSKSHTFDTPIGTFTYRSLSLHKYSVGFDQLTISPEQHFLIASPVKALADIVWTDTRFKPRKPNDFASYLHEDLRIDPQELEQIDPGLLQEITNQYGSRKIRLLQQYLQRYKTIIS